MEKNQKETGTTLSLRRSEAIHCTRKRLKKKACPRKPIDSQNCSVVMIGASLDHRSWGRATQRFYQLANRPHLTGDGLEWQQFFVFSSAIWRALPSARREWPHEMLRRAGPRPDACHLRGNVAG